MNILKKVKKLPILRRFLTPTSAIILQSVTPPPVQSWANSEEPTEDYGPAGYQPVAVGDLLGSRYRVLRKLGWGVYSTVWLVQNESDTSQNLAALKLLTGFATDAAQLHELEYLQCVRDGSHLPGHSHVLQLVDHLYHHGPSRQHLCLVTELLTEDMHTFSRRWKNHRMPTSLLKQVTQQVILGLDYLHNECNIIHTDIKPANILLALPDNVSSSSAPPGGFDVSPETSTATSPDGCTVIRVRSRPIPYPFPDGDLNATYTWSKAEVRLADLGVACWADKVSEHFTDLIQSPALRAPEVCVGAGWGKPADIWSLGCTIYELAMGQPLFPRDVREETVLYLHTIVFGDYPVEMVNRGRYRDVYFNPDGSPNIQLPQRTSLEKTLHRHGAPPHADVFTDFLKHMLTLDPTRRASCQELLTHQWLGSSHLDLRSTPHPLSSASPQPQLK